MNTPHGRATIRLSLLLSLWLALPMGGACSSGGGEAATPEGAMLDDLLSASSDRAFQAALRKHGRIQPEEIPALEQAANGWSEKRRRNAVTALGLIDHPEALRVLRARAAETHDPVEWATAARTLLDGPDAEAVATARPEMVTRAMQNDDPKVKGVGFSAALIAGRDDAMDALEQQLADRPKGDALLTLVDAVQRMRPGRFEARLLALYVKEPDGVMADALVAALARGTGTEAGAEVSRRLYAMKPQVRGGLLTALRGGTAPWVRALLLDLAAKDDPDRTTALKALIEDGPAADWMRVCVQIFEETPSKEENYDRWSLFRIYQEPCRDWASQQAGHKVESEDTLAALRAWLAEHEPPPTTP